MQSMAMTATAARAELTESRGSFTASLPWTSASSQAAWDLTGVADAFYPKIDASRREARRS